MHKKNKKGALRENIEAILIAIVLALFIRAFFVQAFKIPSGSMKDTLLIGDHILVNKFIYGVRIPFTNGATLFKVSKPERKDIIVFKYPEDPDKDFIKRVVAVEGDIIELKNKKIYLNGKLQHNENYTIHTDPFVMPEKFSNRDNFGPVTVPKNSFFVMGDNRDNSHDSRFWGFVDFREVKGKAFIIYWSWNKEKFGVRWNRIGDLLR
ncbi:MAG: signal peptidase I [Desulfobacteraceae bacterium 4572_130]|nr:MAG: signal peptidase I [Desulfobacteraceae bacterium 4572_130]